MRTSGDLGPWAVECKTSPSATSAKAERHPSDNNPNTTSTELWGTSNTNPSASGQGTIDTNPSRTSAEPAHSERGGSGQ